MKNDSSGKNDEASVTLMQSQFIKSIDYKIILNIKMKTTFIICIQDLFLIVGSGNKQKIFK